MIEVGAKLGGKYFVLNRQERIVVGERFEVRTAQGEVRWAQWLHDAALTQAQVAALQAELSMLPAHPLLRTPDELVTSPGGIPAAVFHTAAPRSLVSLTAGMQVAGQEERRLAAIRAVTSWFASLAETLGSLHVVKLTHGAVSLSNLGADGEGESAKVLLLGFGIEPARRLARGGARPTPRSDLAAIVLTAQKLLEQLGARFSGAALVRWDVLRNCARAGDHTALTLGAVLAQSLRELAAEEEAVHRAKSAMPKNPTVTPAAPSVPARARSPHLRTLVLTATALAGLGALATFTAQRYANRTRQGSTSQTSLASARCGDEPMRPPVSVEVPTAAAEVAATCRGGATLTLVARTTEGLWLTQRPARRGEAFRGTAQPIAEGATAVSVLADAQDPWVAWTQPTGAPFGAARLGEQPSPRALSQASWRAGQFRGVWLLRAESDALWVASNLLSSAGARAVVLRLPTAERGAPEAFLLGDGAVVAAIAGAASTLLLHEGDTLRTVTVAQNALSVLAGDAAAPDPAGGVDTRTVPPGALPRSESWHVPGRWVLAAPAGVAVQGGARHFAVTVGNDPLPEGCFTPTCSARGVVYALAFADRGAPSASRLSSRGLANTIALDPDGARWLSGWGAGTARPAVWSLIADAATERLLDVGEGPSAIVACGDERWIARAEAAPTPRLVASPLPCALLGAH